MDQACYCLTLPSLGVGEGDGLVYSSCTSVTTTISKLTLAASDSAFLKVALLAFHSSSVLANGHFWMTALLPGHAALLLGQLTSLAPLIPNSFDKEMVLAAGQHIDFLSSKLEVAKSHCVTMTVDVDLHRCQNTICG